LLLPDSHQRHALDANDTTIKDQFLQNETVVAIIGVKIMDILPNIIKALLYRVFQLDGE
jgi:hypothetical protein